jgi:hypothetical protein
MAWKLAEVGCLWELDADKDAQPTERRLMLIAWTARNAQNALILGEDRTKRITWRRTEQSRWSFSAEALAAWLSASISGILRRG